MVYLFIIAVAAVGIAEGLPLRKKKLHKELLTLGSLLGISVLLVVLRAFGATTPFEWINNLLIPIGKFIFKYH